LPARARDLVAIWVDDDWRSAFRTSAPTPSPPRRTRDRGRRRGSRRRREALGREVLEALGFAVVGAEGYEADDVIAT
jgi:hypothetical protein